MALLFIQRILKGETAIRNTQNLQYKKYKQAKMKFSAFYLTSLTLAAETDDTAIKSLSNLEKISLEFVSAGSINRSSRWKAKWERKFKNNTARMRRSFDKCGTINVEENDEIQMEYDIGNPCGAIEVIMNGFSNWADRYIASCKGQIKKSHQ